jgi:hypothetical protein
MESVVGYAADTGASVRAYAVARRLPAALETRWLAWAAGDAAALLRLAEALGLGANQLDDLLTWLEEIAARETTCPAALLAAAEVQGILGAPLGRGDKLKRVKAWLRRRRFPRLCALEEALEREVRALGLGAVVQVRFPAALEGDEVTVEIRARRPETLRAAVERLGAAVAGGAFDRIFALLDEAP